MKTSPIGVRFEDDELEFIKNRENLKTAQQVIYFLTKEYCKLWRTERKSVFDVPTEEQTNNHIPSDNQAKENFYSPPKIRRSFEYYHQARIDCQTVDGWEELKGEILNSELSLKQKTLLTT